ncbi:hypothetical protein PIB30_044272 [Stylosanthes scabra]|uniref:Uncharacterized protein n=1 Tax=Stylosanthes scabra TaxID=79078 RepID=A0ABU6RGE1_9FABA|nr:hypothetical protein [Stylosanthes scabra]
MSQRRRCSSTTSSCWATTLHPDRHHPIPHHHRHIPTSRRDQTLSPSRPRLHGSSLPPLGSMTPGMLRGPVPQLPMTSRRGSGSVYTTIRGQMEQVHLISRPHTHYSHTTFEHGGPSYSSQPLPQYQHYLPPPPQLHYSPSPQQLHYSPPTANASLFPITLGHHARCCSDSAACPAPSSAPRSSTQTGPTLDLWYGRTLTAAA